MAHQNHKLGFAENFALSGTAAVISKTASAPIERVKLLLQNQDENIKFGRLDRPYKGVIDCTVRVYTEEGLRSFWRSNFVNCLRYFPTQALNFAFKDNVKLCSTVTVAANLICYPIDTVRRRMMLTSGQVVKYKGSWDCANQIMKNEGFMSFMKGAGANIVRGVAGAGVLAGKFDKFKEIYISWRLG